MKVSIDRKGKTVYLTDTTCEWACWAGFYFALLAQDLAGAGGDHWAIRAMSPPRGVCLEYHTIESGNGCGGVISNLVRWPPPPPAPNHCDTCACPPESECCKS